MSDRREQRATLLRRMRVFVASPGDVEEERARLAAVVEELNKVVAERLGVVVELMRWKATSRQMQGSLRALCLRPYHQKRGMYLSVFFGCDLDQRRENLTPLPA